MSSLWRSSPHWHTPLAYWPQPVPDLGSYLVQAATEGPYATTDSTIAPTKSSHKMANLQGCSDQGSDSNTLVIRGLVSLSLNCSQMASNPSLFPGSNRGPLWNQCSTSGRSGLRSFNTTSIRRASSRADSSSNLGTISSWVGVTLVLAIMNCTLMPQTASALKYTTVA